MSAVALAAVWPFVAALGAPSPPPASGHLVPVLPGSLITQIGRRSWLESYWVAGVLLAVALLVLAGWLGSWHLYRRRGRRLTPWLPRWGVRLVAALTSTATAVVGGAIAVNAYAGYLPTLGSVATSHRAPTVLAAGLGAHGAARESRVVSLLIGDPALGEPPQRTYVYLPPGYADPANAHRRYPVVYLIHGFPGGAVDWFRAGRVQRTMDLLLAAHVVGPMIVVGPDANAPHWRTDAECLNLPGGRQIESYLAISVPNAIDRRFRTIPERSGRAIGGMSSGGFCALNLGLHHPHRFSVILASEPYGEPGYNAFRGALHSDRVLYAANAPSDYLPVWHFALPTAVFLDTGSGDPGPLAATRTLARELLADRQPVGIRIATGLPHSWYEARVELPYALAFAYQQFRHLPSGGSDQADAAQVAALIAYFTRVGPPPGPAGPLAPSPLPSKTWSPTPSPTPTRPIRTPQPSVTPIPTASQTVPPSPTPSPSGVRSPLPGTPTPLA